METNSNSAVSMSLEDRLAAIVSGAVEAGATKLEVDGRGLVYTSRESWLDACQAEDPPRN